VSAISAAGHVTTVRFASCAIAFREADDVLGLVGGRGQLVAVDPAEVEHGFHALRQVEDALAPEVFVPAEGSSPEQDAAARAHRRENPDDPAVLEPERRAPSASSTSQPVRITWSQKPGA
jgi:hypothetical protein